MDHADILSEKLRSKSAQVAVVGLGYVGLSLAVGLGKAGIRILGIDVDVERVGLLSNGTSYIGDITDGDIRWLLAEGLLSASATFEGTGQVDAIVICVPTPLRKSKEPDISSIVSAVDSIAPTLRKGQLVVLESTTYPGTTEEVLQSRFEGLGFTLGRDLFLAFSPERVDPGNRTFTSANIPKVVGGVTATCTALAAALYSIVTSKVHRVSNPRVAETAKLLENTFRSVNIALANELALACRAIDVDPWEVIDAAATKPFGFMPFYPGPGTGGHCIPLDPLYLSWRVRMNGFEPRFIALADEINRSMPRHVVTTISDALNERGQCLRDAQVLVLGVTYKRDVNDVRESPALEIIKILIEKGVRISYSDPFTPQLDLGDQKIASTPLTADLLGTSDCVVVVTDHSSFDYPLIARAARLVVDVRNALRVIPDHREHIVTL